MLSFYTTERIISDIWRASDEDNKHIWLNFIEKLRPTLNILLRDDSDYYYNDENPILIIAKNGLSVILDSNERGVNSYISQVISLRLDSIDDPNAVFLLDVSSEDAKKISSKYGIICHSFNDMPHHNPLFNEPLEISTKENVYLSDNWDKIFKSRYFFPSNSLIVIDRYLFSTDRNEISAQDGLDNLFNILDSIIPQSLQVDYHVLIIFDATKLNKKDEDQNDGLFKRISTKINKFKTKLKNNRDINLLVETLSIDKSIRDLSTDTINKIYASTHNRRILSNYFIIRADHSLKIFRESKELYSQTIFIDWLASKGVITSKLSTTPAKGLFDDLEAIKDAVKELKASKEIRYTQNGNSNISIGQIQNRLINF